jgi:hypothetical protein
METEMVTEAASGGATKTAFDPGNTEVIPPLLASQRTTMSGEKPFSTSGSSSPARTVQSAGRMVNVLAGRATAPEIGAIENNDNIATMRAALRGINILCFYETVIRILTQHVIFGVRSLPEENTQVLHFFILRTGLRRLS